MRRARGVAALAGWCVLLAATFTALHAAGQGAMAGPSLRSWNSVRAWISTHDPVLTAMVAVRLCALAACWYLTAVTAIGAAARVLRAGRLVAAVDRCTLSITRRALTAALGAGLAVGSLSGGAVAAAAGSQPPGPAAAAPTMRRLDTTGVSVPPRMHRLPDPAPDASAPAADAGSDAGSDIHTDPHADAPEPGPPTEPAPTPTPPPTAPRSGVGPPTDPAPLPAPPAPAAASPHLVPGPLPEPVETVTLRPGDHLWLVAERALAGAWNRDPTEHEIAPYWRTLVEQNRGRLVDPSNPDLVHPGQVITLPPVPAGGAGP